MLELIFNPKKAEHHPIEIFIIGFIYSSLSIVFSVWVFPEFSSAAMVFLTVFSTLYLVQRAIRVEEKKELSYKSERWLLREHFKLIKLVLFLFLGITVSFSVWAFFVSPAFSSTIFQFQISSVEDIKNNISPTGAFFEEDSLISKIIVNNLKVVLISLIFAIFYGAGAIYVLVWNASVMGVVIGNLAKNTFGMIALPIAFTKYFIHGIPEIAAYLVAVIAGGILYSAFWDDDFKIHGKSKKLILDSITLMIISVVLLTISALIEVYISPLI